MIFKSLIIRMFIVLSKKRYENLPAVNLGNINPSITFLATQLLPLKSLEILAAFNMYFLLIP